MRRRGCKGQSGPLFGAISCCIASRPAHANRQAKPAGVLCPHCAFQKSTTRPRLSDAACKARTHTHPRRPGSPPQVGGVWTSRGVAGGGGAEHATGARRAHAISPGRASKRVHTRISFNVHTRSRGSSMHMPHGREYGIGSSAPLSRMCKDPHVKTWRSCRENEFLFNAPPPLSSMDSRVTCHGILCLQSRGICMQTIDR